ncbi:MAG: formyltransferase family protein [Candidatus Woesearchaeota archaeon]
MNICFVTSKPNFFLENQKNVYCNKQGTSFVYFEEFREIIDEIKEFDFVVLWDYFRKVEPEFVNILQGKLVNIHKSLLPDFKGKGMFGKNILKLVFESKKEAGATLHYVSEEFDEGEVIKQIKVLKGNDFDEFERNILRAEIELVKYLEKTYK